MLATALTIGCAHRYEVDRQREGGSIPGTAFAYVAMPEAGRFQARTYPESGAQTQIAIASAIAPHVGRVWLGDEVEDRDAALHSARRVGASHAIVSRIDHWEDRATEWSGRRDRIIVYIEITEVASDLVADAAYVSGASRRATLGGDHPQDLLRPAIGDYFAVLFR